MPAVENVEWLNRNLLRAYPLHEDADLTPTLPDGTTATGLKVPTCLITDFAFTLAFSAFDGYETSADAVAALPSLTGITRAADGVSLEISFGGSVLATVTATISTHVVNTAYRLVGQGDNADCGGWIVLGDLARAEEELPEGIYRFAAGQVPFEVSTLRLAPRGLRSLVAVGKYGLKTYAPLYGNVKVIAGSDMNIRTDAPSNALWLQAASNTGYERTGACPCGNDALQRVRTINGMAVENVDIVGDAACINVTTARVDDTLSTVTIADSCATPCCGCAELNFVESAVATISKSIETLNAYAEALRTRITELQTNQATTAAAAAAFPT